MMKKITQEFSIAYQYQIHFTEALFATSNALLAEIIRETDKRLPAKLGVVIDAGVNDHHPQLAQAVIDYCGHYSDTITLCGSPLQVQGGEDSKNTFGYVEQVLELINVEKIDRHAFIVAIGGGAVLDMVGFAAAIGHRGIGIIRVPTTVLSQNDSGVGVKNSINYFGKKNFLGTFAPPVAVINDAQFLSTLDDRQWRSGISEAVKVALIKDLSFFEWIENNAAQLADRALQPMQYLIHRCAEMHTDHIGGGDPFEKGSSRPLDFGHWAAHKLEQLSNFEVFHGEAVAIGICLDVVYSHLLGLIDVEATHRVLKCFSTLGFSLTHPLLSGAESPHGLNPELTKGLDEFREHLGGQLTIMLLESLGKGVEYHEMDEKLIGAAVKYLEEYTVAEPA